MQEPHWLMQRKKVIHWRGHGLAVFDAVCHDAKGVSLGFRESLILSLAIYHAARQVNNIGNPATIILPLDLDFQIHNRKLSQKTGGVQ
jgi:hypothetical protein